LEGISKQREEEERQQVSIGEVLKTLEWLQYSGKLVLIFEGAGDVNIATCDLGKN
jgi:hypothetical protein